VKGTTVINKYLTLEIIFLIITIISFGVWIYMIFQADFIGAQYCFLFTPLFLFTSWFCRRKRIEEIKSHKENNI
jgi:hypothetical protein